MLRQSGPSSYPDHMGPALVVISLIGAIGCLMLLFVIQ